MITLYIVRHGETEENANGILQGHLQGHLSDLGRQQAHDLRKRIAHDFQPDHIESSDLQRTIDTAHILNEAWSVPIVTTPLLRERDWGTLTGALIATLPHDFPPSVEPVPQMMVRARQYLLQLLQRYQDEDLTLLIVSHGVFSRCLQAAAHGQQIFEVPRMNNGECRKVVLTAATKKLLQQTVKDDVTDDNTDWLKQGSES